MGILAILRNKTFMVVGALVFAIQVSAQAPERVTEPRTRIPVSFLAENGMFPKEWTVEPINAVSADLDVPERERSAKVVLAAMAVYPAEFLKRELKAVYVTASIEFYGLAYGGTNSLDTVYLSNKGAAKGYSDAYIWGSFHHEFSSILLRNHPKLLDDKAWAAANPQGFSYGQGGTEALRDGKASTKYDPALAALGFVAEYAKASFEEDFNMIAEGLFSGNPEFWKLVDENPNLATKARLAMGFYQKLLPEYTEDRFRGLVPPVALKTGR